MVLKSVSLAFVLAGIKLVHGSAVGRSVSLLFENDGDWTRFGEKPSALFFHEALTLPEAENVCKENNETLLSPELFSSFKNQLSYFQSIGHTQDEFFWFSNASETTNTTAISLKGVVSISDAESSRHAFLCTNSAPHTTKVDTDFSASPTTTVTANGISFTGTRDHLTFRFMGIPYAQAPVDDLRFRYPQRFNGTSVDATAFRPACLQFGYFENNNQGLNPWGTSEDCLFLNVYTPFIPSNTSNDTSQLKPVLLWIHGGGNTGGTGADATFDGGPLVSRGDVVVVTINYRLNIFGFLALDDGVVTGNYALADKILALEWVKENIAAFGGDPNKVMIFGQSAGGWSIVDLLRSPKAEGLFHTAIIQSGGSSSFRTQKKATAVSEPVISQFCNGTGEERLGCLQALPAETILNMTSTISQWPSVQDGVYVLEEAVAQVGRGPDAVNSVPVIAGFMPEEGQSLMGTTISPNATDFNASLVAVSGSEMADAVLGSGLWKITDDYDVYNATVNVETDQILTCAGVNFIHTAAKSKAFPALYVYNMLHAYALSYYNPFGLCSFPVGQPQPYYRCHSGDLYEVFGTYHIFDQPPRIDEDIYYTNLLQDLWVSFARTGDPNPSLDYLRSRGPAYESTVKILEETEWVWPEFGADKEVMASLDYPDLGYEDGLPEDRNGKCAVICEVGCTFG